MIVQEKVYTDLTGYNFPYFIVHTDITVFPVKCVDKFDHSHKKWKDSLETLAEVAVLHTYVENQAILEPTPLYHASKCKQTKAQGSEDCLWFILISIMAFSDVAKSRVDWNLVLFLPIIGNTLSSAALLWGIVSKNKAILVTCSNFGLRCAHIMSILWHTIFLVSSKRLAATYHISLGISLSSMEENLDMFPSKREDGRQPLKTGVPRSNREGWNIWFMDPYFYLLMWLLSFFFIFLSGCKQNRVKMCYNRLKFVKELQISTV